MTGIHAKQTTLSPFSPSQNKSKPSRGAKHQSRRNAQRIARLCEYWPRFSQEGGLTPLPLSIGIDKQMHDDAAKRGIVISEKEIRHGLHAYAKRASYLRTIANGGMRVDLFSSETELVAPEHQANALATLNALRDRKAKSKSK